MSHSITEQCIGCASCRRSCPVDAISGNTKELHVIDPILCIDCGTCGRVCPKAAVLDPFGNTVERLKKKLWPRPVVKESACYACENCVAACPTDALAMKDEELPLEENHAVLAFPDRCVSCGWCVDNCQFDAIALEAGHEGN